MMKSLHKVSAIFLTAVLLAVAVHATVFAIPAVDPTQTGSISVHYEDTANARFISGAQIDLYYVAEISADAKYTKAGAFENLPVEVNGLTSAEDWRNLGYTLKLMTTQNNISPDNTGTTDGNGDSTVSSLKAGLWLVVPQSQTIDDMTYTADAFMVSLPQLNSATDTWEYDIDPVLKFSVSDDPLDEPSSKSVVRRVRKIWDDNGKTANRPAEISVTLYAKDGTSGSTPTEAGKTTLSEANGWSYTWSNLDQYNSSGDKIDYYVTEDVIPNGYSVSYTPLGNSNLTIKNFIPKPVSSSGNSGGSSGGSGSGSVGGFGRYLPKTGQLLWPIPVLLGAGILFLILGVFVDQRRKF